MFNIPFTCVSLPQLLIALADHVAMAVVIADPGTLKVGLAWSVALCWRDLHAQSIIRAALTVKRLGRSF